MVNIIGKLDIIKINVGNLLYNIWSYLLKIGNNCGCHQRPDRSFFIFGYQFPICSRCTGILVGQIVGLILYIFGVRILLLIDICFLIIMFIDWFLQYKNILISTNIRRFITGNLAGIAQISIITKIIIVVKILILNCFYGT